MGTARLQGEAGRKIAYLCGRVQHLKMQSRSRLAQACRWMARPHLPRHTLLQVGLLEAQVLRLDAQTEDSLTLPTDC